MKLETKKNKFGFTLIELIVVISIMAILTLITVANFRQGEKQKRVGLASDTVISSLRDAQTYALAGKNTNNSNPACTIPQYYRVDFYYSIDSTIYVYARNACSSTDSIEVNQLPQSTRIKAGGLSVNGTPIASTTLFLSFSIPYGNLTISTDNAATFSTFTQA